MESTIKMLFSEKQLNIYNRVEWRNLAKKALYSEWYNRVNRLPKKMRPFMSQPTIIFNDNLAPWGRYFPGLDSIIELKTALIDQHPWYSILEVFFHEMAHQLVASYYAFYYKEEVLNETSHGKRFHEACHLLGANPAASGDYPLADQRVFAEEAENAETEENKFLLKIRKLLSLSERSDQNEANAALQKALELSERYSISLLDAKMEEATDYHAIGIGPVLSRIEIVDVMITHILKDFYNVLCLWLTVPDIDLAKEYGSRLYIHGTKSNIKIATYAYDWLKHQLEQGWRNLDPKLKINAHARWGKRDFSVGLLNGFRETLEKHQVSQEIQALVKQENAKLEEYFRWLYPRIRKSQSKTRQVNAGLSKAGQEQGKKLQFKDAIEQETQKRKKLNR